LKRRWSVCLIAAATFSAVAVYTFRMEPVYEASSVLLIRLGRSYTPRPELDEKKVREIRDSQAVINAELQILRSYDVAKKVVEDLGRERMFPSLEDDDRDDSLSVDSAVRKFKRNLHAKGVTQSDMIRVSYQHKDPELAAEIVNHTVEVFEEKHLDAFDDPQALPFLEDKVDNYRGQVKSASAALKIFQVEHPGSLKGLLEQLAEVEADLRSAPGRISGLEERFDYLNEVRFRSRRALTTVSQPIQRAQGRLLELHLKQQELLAVFVDDDRRVVDVRRQIRIVTDFISAETAKPAPSAARIGLDTQIIDTEAELRSQRAQLRALQVQLTGLNADLAELHAQEAVRRNLVRERDLAESYHGTYLQRLEDTRITGEMNRQKIANIAVLQKAITPTKPVAPKKRINLVVGMILGLAFGVGYALLRAFALEPALWRPWGLSHDEADEALSALDESPL
jgi:uncharacterized protein involved in exopolysaccharide biosynthesis